jgi:hypothetical protein
MMHPFPPSRKTPAVAERLESVDPAVTPWDPTTMATAVA